MTVIRRRASEIAPAILRCYNATDPISIKYRVIFIRADRISSISDFALEVDAKAAAAWWDHSYGKSVIHTVISSEA